MIGKNREAASDQHRKKKEVEKVTIPHPHRKTMRTGGVVGKDLWDRRNMRKSQKKKLDPGSKHGQSHQHRCGNEDRGPYPNAQAAIRWIMNGGVCRIERNHCTAPEKRPSMEPGLGAVATMLHCEQLLIVWPGDGQEKTRFNDCFNLVLDRSSESDETSSLQVIYLALRLVVDIALQHLH
jgi:hypothetical protein